MPEPDQLNNDPSFQADMEAFNRVMLGMNMAFRKQLTQTLSEFQLTPPQFGALMTLDDRPHGCMMSEVAAAVHQVPATMTGIIDRLYERQLVERHIDPSNRRSWRVSLTQQGHGLIEEIKHRQHAHLMNVLNTFSAHDRQELIRLLGRYLELTLTHFEDLTV
jgi:DNA-binding MarR family transcriptional regulator